jgi:hypothetical protein
MIIAHGKLQLFLDGKEIPITNVEYCSSPHYPRLFDISVVAHPYDSVATIKLHAMIPRDNCEGNAFGRIE